MAQQAWDEDEQSLAELQKVLLSTETVEQFLRELAVRAARLVAGGLSCGMTLGPTGRAYTAACSDERASEVDEVQYRLNDGPCLAAMRKGIMTRIDDTAAESRWPVFASRAAALGVGATLSLPLGTPGEPRGALNLYAPSPHAFGPAETRRAQRFAANGSGALALAHRLASYTALTSQLRESLASRAVIDQAIGIIMAGERCTQEQAFAILRSASQNRNIKLRELAEEIVTRVAGAAPQPPPFSE
jgi:GAF domain-containing protein